MLNTERQIGFGAVGPIPYRAIIIYLDENEVEDKEERGDMIFFINEMDAEYGIEVHMESAFKQFT